MAAKKKAAAPVAPRQRKAKAEPLTKFTLLKGEGIHQHTMYGGELEVELDKKGELLDYARVILKEDSVLRHEKPDGTFGEHKALKVTKGQYYTGKQVEYNPFDQTVSRVWD